MSHMGHSRPIHSVLVPINVRCYANSGIIVWRSEVTLRANKRHRPLALLRRVTRPTARQTRGAPHCHAVGFPSVLGRDRQDFSGEERSCNVRLKGAPSRRLFEIKFLSGADAFKCSSRVNNQSE